MHLTYEPYHWLLPNPFVIPWTIAKGHIDHYNHANNVAYVSQLEQTSWAHSNALGLSIEQYQALDRGMAIRLAVHIPIMKGAASVVVCIHGSGIAM